MEAVAPLSSPTAADQEHGAKAVLCLRKAFCARVSIHFSLLKCVQGAGENELESVQCPAFLRAAITGDPQRQRDSNKPRGQSQLLCTTLLLHLLIFFGFYDFLLFLLVFVCLVCAYFCLSLSVFSLCLFFVPIFPSPLSHFLKPCPILISSHLQSTASILDYLMSG